MIRISLLLLFIANIGCLFAQDGASRQMIDSSAIRYLRSADKQSLLYYGNQQEAHPRTTNHPYLKDDKFTKARLSHYGVLYPEALLRLDLSRNELIIVSPDFRQIVLFPENVDFAEMHDKHIIYFRSDTLPGSPSSGYFMLLHSGDCKVIEKINANIMHNNSSTSTEWYYQFSTRFYLYKDGVYHTIRNRKGLFKVLKPQKKELKRFISANHLKFRQDKETFITLTVKEYEKLSESL